VAEPLKQPHELLNLDRRPHPRGNELQDLMQLLLEGVGAVLHNQRVIHRQLVSINQKEDLVMADLGALQTSVQATTDAEQAAIDLLGQLSALISQNATDPAALQALADQLDTKKNDLAAAIVANTPAAPPAP